MPGKPLFSAEHLLDLYLRCDAGMVGSGDPEGVVALHSFCSYDDVLKRVVQSMTHMELSRDVRGRDDHREGQGVFVA